MVSSPIQPPKPSGDDGAADLPFVIELWDEAAAAPERVLGRAASAALGQAIFDAARQEYQGRYITLRRGERIIARTAES